MRIVSILLAVLLATAAAARTAETGDETYVKVGDQRARLVACFREVTVPAKYSVKHVLLTPPKRQYIKRRSGRIELVEIPAVYVEERTLLEPEYILLRQIACR